MRCIFPAHALCLRPKLRLSSKLSPISVTLFSAMLIVSAIVTCSLGALGAFSKIISHLVGFASVIFVFNHFISVLQLADIVL